MALLEVLECCRLVHFFPIEELEWSQCARNQVQLQSPSAAHRSVKSAALMECLSKGGRQGLSSLESSFWRSPTIENPFSGHLAKADYP